MTDKILFCFLNLSFLLLIVFCPFRHSIPSSPKDVVNALVFLDQSKIIVQSDCFCLIVT
jgi:hypothetical protein